MEKAQIVLYSSYLYKIGGIETFVFNFVEFFKDYDIMVMCPEIAHNVHVRLSKVVRIAESEDVECDSLIMIRPMDARPNVKYRQLVRMVHGCKSFKSQDVINDYDHLVHVSEESRISYNSDGQVIHNLLAPNKKKSLLLVSATRIPARDKGKNADRMLTLANMLHKAEIDFIWLNFSDGQLLNAPKGLINVGIYDNMQSYTAKADYLVQLSDSEGWSYSVLEALTNNTPVIVTPFKTAFEMGIEDGVNGYIVPFDMSFDVTRLLNVPRFKYKYDNDKIIGEWKNVLGEPIKRTTSLNPKSLIKTTKPYIDMTLNRNVKKGEEIVVTEKRAKDIIGAGVAEYERR